VYGPQTIRYVQHNPPTVHHVACSLDSTYCSHVYVTTICTLKQAQTVELMITQLIGQ